MPKKVKVRFHTTVFLNADCADRAITGTAPSNSPKGENDNDNDDGNDDYNDNGNGKTHI